MDQLVNKYERAVEDLLSRDRKIADLTDGMVQRDRDNEQLYQQNQAHKAEIERQKAELFDVYGSLRRKEEVLRGMEERLNRKLNDKEE